MAPGCIYSIHKYIYIYDIVYKEFYMYINIYIYIYITKVKKKKKIF